MAGYSNAIYHTEQQKSLKSYSKNAIGMKKASKKGHFAHIGNEIKICTQNKCHHHLSNVCENSFRMFHSIWVISDYHSFVWQFEFPWLNLTNCPNKWMVIRNDPVTVKHTKWIFKDIGKVMMAFILATDFDFIAYMSNMAFFFFGSFFHANGVFGIWYSYPKELWKKGARTHVNSKGKIPSTGEILLRGGSNPCCHQAGQQSPTYYQRAILAPKQCTIIHVWGPEQLSWSCWGSLSTASRVRCSSGDIFR